MSDLGIAKINPEEARNKAELMRSLAKNINTLLDDVSKRMAEINDEDTGTYQGTKKASELREELDEFKKSFSNFYEQINTYAANIDAIANQMLVQ